MLQIIPAHRSLSRSGHPAWALLVLLLAVPFVGLPTSADETPFPGDRGARYSALPTTPPEAESAKSLPGVVFVGGPIVDGKHEEYEGSFHWRDGYVYPKGATNNAWERTHAAARPGRNLFALVPARPDGTLTQLTFLKQGNVFDPEPSFDGQKVLFSMRRDTEDWYHLYEINIDGTGLKQLTNGPYNDVSGVYLPDGRIVFCSDRAGYLDEYHEERSEMLFRMNGDGSGLEQITFTPGNYFEPTVLANGTLVCSFWDAFHISVPPFIKHETYLISLRPDGTEERHLFGAGQYQFYNRTRHAAIGLTRASELPGGRLLVQSEMGPSIYDPNLGIDLATALAPIFPGTASVQTGGTTHTMHLSPLGTRASPYGLADGRFLMAATLPGSRDIGLYVVDPATRDIRLVFDRTNLSEWDAVPVGLARQKPRAIPDQPKNDSGMATFVVAAGRQGDTDERNQLNSRAQFARVLAAEPTELALSSHTSLETRVLGVVPVLPDGSIAFEAPADTPVFIETLAADGDRLVLQAGYMTARSGETKSCFGCHAPQSEAVPGVSLLATKLPLTRITHEPTDLSYRRNEPDEYRRQAAIGSAPIYRTWLTKSDAEIRRAGAELLAYLPDEVTAADRLSLMKLLEDPADDVRRQAAHSLAMIGSADEIPALLARLGDDDWQTRFFAAMALEAITGANRELLCDPVRASEVWAAWWKPIGSPEAWVASLSAQVDTLDWRVAQRLAWVHRAPSVAARDLLRPAIEARVLAALSTDGPPAPEAVATAGWWKLASALPKIEPWLVGGGNPRVEESVPDADDSLEREVRGMRLGKEAALAVGRIGTEAAITSLWNVLAKTVPNRDPIPSRHYQTGPRPEEYTYLRALLLAGAKPTLDHVPNLIGLLPSTFGEKPRFEDRTKPIESQRAGLARKLLERTDLLPQILDVARHVLKGDADVSSPLYKQLLAGSNNDRPYSEHGHPFPVLKALEPEQALQYLACLSAQPSDAPEALVRPYLTSAKHRERIEAAVVLRRLGIADQATRDLILTEVRKPYPFSEIWSIGKGRFELRFRDKAYLLMALAASTPDVAALAEFTSDTTYYRDIRLGLALGLGMRANHSPDAEALLMTLASDPIYQVHRTARLSRDRLRSRARYRDESLPNPTPLPAYQPLARGTSPITPWEFTERTPDAESGPAKQFFAATNENAALQALYAAASPEAYASVGNTFARNAERMRLYDARFLEEMTLWSASEGIALTPELDAALDKAIQSPFPFAHYLAAKFIVVRGEPRLAQKLVPKLADYVAQADTVGVYWAADAVGRLRPEGAFDALRSLAEPKPFAKTYGSIGMAYGFSAARGLGLFAASPSEELVKSLLVHDNVWLRAGVLEGLAARGHAELPAVLKQLQDDAPSLFLEEQARFAAHQSQASQ